MKPIERFVKSIRHNENNGCWEWKAAKDPHGYGIMFDKEPIRATKWSLEFFVEKLEDGHVVCHKCDNPPCVNPQHLFQGTHQTNYDDAYIKGRQNRKLKEEQVIEIRRLLLLGVSARKIAKEMGVYKNTINLIRDKKTFKWVK